MIWALVLASLVVVLAMVRYHHDARVSDWVFSLSPEHRVVMRGLEDQVQREHAALLEAFARVLSITEPELALRLLRSVLAVVEAVNPERLDRLRWIVRLSKMAAAIRPPAPVRPGTFRLGSLRTLAGLGLVAHALLVSPAERLVLRARFLMVGFGFALRVLRRATDRAAWERFELALGDWRALDLEHVETTRELLLAVSAVPAGEPKRATP